MIAASSQLCAQSELVALRIVANGSDEIDRLVARSDDGLQQIFLRASGGVTMSGDMGNVARVPDVERAGPGDPAVGVASPVVAAGRRSTPVREGYPCSGFSSSPSV